MKCFFRRSLRFLFAAFCSCWLCEKRFEMMFSATFWVVYLLRPIFVGPRATSGVTVDKPEMVEEPVQTVVPCLPCSNSDMCNFSAVLVKVGGIWGLLVAPLGLPRHLVSVQQAEGVDSLMVGAVESNGCSILVGVLSCAGRGHGIIVVVVVVANLVQIAGWDSPNY